MKKSASLDFRIFDWSGHNAIGDDMLAAVTRATFRRAAEKAGVVAGFGRGGLNVCGAGTILGQGLDFWKMYARFLLERRPYLVFASGARKSGAPLKAWERAVLQRFCQGALQIGVRGGLTRDWLLAQGVAAPVEVIGDAALGFEPVDLPPLAAESFKVGVSLRHMGGGLLGEEQGSDNARNVRLFARICDAMVREYGASLYFFDLCENRFDRDMAAIQGVLGAMEARGAAERAVVFSIQENQDPMAAFSRLGQMDYVFSQRMHPSLTAWVQGVPSVGLEYQFEKTRDAFDPLGLGPWVLEIGALEVDGYLEKMAALLAKKEAVIAESQARVQELRGRQAAFLGPLFEGV